MQIWFIFSLVFAVFVALFAVLNSEIVTIRVLWAKYELSQSVVILISAAFGALVTYTMSLFGKFKSSMKSSKGLLPKTGTVQLSLRCVANRSNKSQDLPA